MDAIRLCCAGLDVHQANVVACVLTGPLESKPQKLIREFSTVLPGLLALSDWLSELNCTEVAMESTGVYWKPVFNVLEGTCTITLANAFRIKNVPGRKTDKKDAEWIADLHRCGLIEGSFIAPKEIRELRDLTRYRKKLKGYETSERNRIIKVLEDANIKISSFVSDVFGKSGRLMLEALVDGEIIDPEKIADLAIGRMRPKIPQLTEALNGRVTLHHRKIIKRSLLHLQFLEGSISELESEMEEYFSPYQENMDLLQTIPGVGETVAQIILSEVGTDMNVFPSSAHITSWAGLSPGNNESAGKKKRTQARPGNRNLRSALLQASWAASKTHTFLGAKYWSVCGHAGKKRAAVAVARKILVIAYYVLNTGIEYNELGYEYLERRKPITTEQFMIRRLERSGYIVTSPEETA